MATIFRSHRRYRVAVNSLDHPPPHVHAFGKGREARFVLNCPAGPIELWDFIGDWTVSHLNELGGRDRGEARRMLQGLEGHPWLNSRP